MKKIIVLIAIISILSGCSFGGNEKAKNVQTYQNTKLGISFQYPETLGKVWENNYKKTELFALKFLDEKDNPVALDLAEAGYETLRTCNDILTKGFANGDRMPSDCETLNIDNHSVIILTYIQKGMSNSTTNAEKEAHFQTKKGIWAFSATDRNLYDDLLHIAKTIRYLQ